MTEEAGGGRSDPSGSVAPPLEAWVLPPWASPPEQQETLESEGPEIRTAAPDARWLREIADGLRETAEELRAVPVDRIVEALGTVGRRLLDPGDDLRSEALALLPATSGLSPAMAEAVLDGMAADWTRERLQALLEAELPDPAALDRGVPVASGRRVRALGPALAVQVVSGSVPGVGATALLRSLLVKGPTLVKPGRGDLVLPLLAARAVAAVHPVLGRSMAVVYWSRGREEAEKAALSAADVVVAYGGDAAVARLRARSPATTRVVGYHHRVGVGAVGRRALEPERAAGTAREVARAAAFFDQRGCVSPQVVWVEEGGAESPRSFARRVAHAFAELEDRLPGGRLDPGEASALHQLRGTEELRAAAGAGVEVRHGGAASWTVIWDPDPAFAPTCVGRVLRLKPLTDLLRLPGLLEPVARHLQTVGLAGAGGRAAEVAEALARIGASRITSFRDVPFPPPWWHHDGQGALAVLLRWADLEDVDGGSAGGEPGPSGGGA